MKKIITGTLITAIISNNVAYCDTMKNQLADGNEDVEVTQTIDDELENSWNEDSLEKNQSKDIIQSTEEKVESVDKVQVVEELVDKSATGDTTQQFLDIPVVITQEYVTDFTSLADAIKKSNIEITIKNDITLQGSEVLNVTGKNVTINGGGFTLDLNQVDSTDTTNKFVIKSNDTIVEDLKIKNYINNGISVYRVSGIELRNIELIGRDKNTTAVNEQSKVGIDLDNSTVIMENITCSNHRLWVGTKSGLNIIDENLGINNNRNTGRLFISNISRDYLGNIWISTKDSIFMYNIKEAQRYNLLIINDQGVKKYNIKEKDVEDIYNIEEGEVKFYIF
ncbi:pectate lyase-like adhesive domain-containing protein [Clostridium sp. D43t1_170807_H7]|uniref:pectate lyase-like adhesive domain-containing protein n=1 Tax=Clostridium sp. D43t1_170807_H7 TaxID=2787140 RepID=UPI001896B4B9|nr:pectate lyase-like adhesive domain-containing protein [Clostridium sp. D43t1_170807_H7]MEE0933843.1 pectate lyase-like adhesive domain-containing protein [Clostridium sp.]